MATENEVLARQKEVTERISTQVRTLAVSFLALVWLFLVPGKDGAPVLPHAVEKNLLLIAGASALAAMVLDFLQYLAAYLTVRHTLRNPRKVTGKPDEYEFHYKLLRHRAQTWLFWAKQLAIAASFGSLVIGFWGALFG